MSSTLPIVRDSRRRDLDAAAGQTVFTLPVPVFDLADVAVYSLRSGIDPVRNRLSTGFELSFVEGDGSAVQVVFAVAPRPAEASPPTTIFLESRRLQERVTNATRNGVIQSSSLERDLDRVSTVLQEVRRDIDDAGDVQAARALAQSAKAAAEAARDIAENFASDIVSQGNVPIYASRASAAAATIPAGITALRTNGYATPGDGGNALYRKMTLGEAAAPGEFTGADGVRWAIAETTRNVRMYGAVGDNVANDTAAFIAACSVPGLVIVDRPKVAWKIVGTVPYVSNFFMQFIGRPTLNIDASGNERGLWIGHGVTNGIITGDATINLTVNSNGPDGSYNTAIGGGDFYVTGTPARYGDIRISGNILINSIGTANGKPVQWMGYADNILVDGVVATGRSNYCFTTHWCGNGNVGVLPTSTWHPDNITWRNCRAEGYLTQTLRGFTSTASGRVLFDRCVANNMATQSFNPFCGDYGFTYCANIDPINRGQTVAVDCVSNGCRLVLSWDYQSSGLNGSPIWSGNANGASLALIRLRSRVPGTSAGSAFGFTDGASLIIEDLDHAELGTAQTSNWAALNGIGTVRMSGRAVTLAQMLVRNCGTVTDNISARNVLPGPSTTTALALSAQSADTTTTANAFTGGTQIALANIGVTTGAGAGCYLAFTISGVAYEVEVLSSAMPSTAATLTISPLPVDVPSGTTVTLISTVKKLTVRDCTKEGWSKCVAVTGTAIAKIREAFIPSTCKSLRHGTIAFDLDAIEYVEASPSIDQGGLAASGTKAGVLIGANVTVARSGPKIGKNCTKIRYGVQHTAGAATIGIVAAGACQSIDTAASNPAYAFIPAGVNVTFGADNTVAAGITAKYP